ncbi:MAG TPA: NUMOD3 domain-containing DNA-binding protein, partial [Candidatus Paceibacterota bacterium]|nr:NUMOD3 domain-containing DNA-binding protein [Candidatus Paceibacterota bacterium]
MGKKYFRKCPLCKKELRYTNKKNRNTANKKCLLCSSCSHKKAHKRPEVILKMKKVGAMLKVKYSGEGNPFYGKKHSKETKNKLKKVDKSYTQTDEFKKKCVKKGINNGMYGKSVYNIWVEKYGKEIADNNQRVLNRKRSINASGKKNSMYVKPTPQGSGNGWSGWYKGWFFRSLRELSYMIKEIETKNKKWRTAETKDLKIKYV